MTVTKERKRLLKIDALIDMALVLESQAACGEMTPSEDFPHGSITVEDYRIWKDEHQRMADILWGKVARLRGK